MVRANLLWPLITELFFWCGETLAEAKAAAQQRHAVETPNATTSLHFYIYSTSLHSKHLHLFC